MLKGATFRRLLLRRTVIEGRASVWPESYLIAETSLTASIGLSLEISGSSEFDPDVITAC